MKNIKYILLFMLSLGIWSCTDNDDDIKVLSGETLDKVAMLNALETSDFVITETTADVEGNEKSEVEFSWTESKGNYNGSVQYFLQIDVKGNEFTNAVYLPLTSEGGSELKQKVTYGELNQAINKINTALTTSGSNLVLDFSKSNEFEIRVISQSQTSGYKLVGKPISIKVKAYEKVVVVKPKLFLVGSVQQYYGVSQWTPEKGLEMRYIGDGTTKVFEAYIKANEGDIFKMVSNQAKWSDVSGNYGTIDNAQDGNLKNGGDSGNISISEKGQYYLKVDIDNMKYQLVKMQWGAIGNATPGGWSEETPMTYDFASNTWSADLSLTDGEVKFRSKVLGDAIFGNEWKFNIGVNKTAWDEADGNFKVSAGNTTLEITIDFLGYVKVSGI
ncbi:MAG: SusE domain-containing protein [Flavobacteriaceae bacterium]|nr:SusE domain-containing protein [Flavobacteriaceae bacterium]